MNEEWIQVRLRRHTRLALQEWIIRTVQAAQRASHRTNPEYSEGMSIDDAVMELLCRDNRHRVRSREQGARKRQANGPCQQPPGG